MGNQHCNGQCNHLGSGASFAQNQRLAYKLVDILLACRMDGKPGAIIPQATVHNRKWVVTTTLTVGRCDWSGMVVCLQLSCPGGLNVSCSACRSWSVAADIQGWHKIWSKLIRLAGLIFKHCKTNMNSEVGRGNYSYKWMSNKWTIITRHLFWL